MSCSVCVLDTTHTDTNKMKESIIFQGSQSPLSFSNYSILFCVSIWLSFYSCSGHDMMQMKKREIPKRDALQLRLEIMWTLSIAHLNRAAGEIGERLGDHMLIHLRVVLKVAVQL